MTEMEKINIFNLAIRYDEQAQMFIDINDTLYWYWTHLFTELLTEFKQLGIENEFVEYMSQQEEWI
ncbi:MAG: hypothetical protein IJ371_01240 [Clostridia bacterium]|nr:hypothetical protein [Clostridia bacterium]